MSQGRAGGHRHGLRPAVGFGLPFILALAALIAWSGSGDAQSLGNLGAGQLQQLQQQYGQRQDQGQSQGGGTADQPQTFSQQPVMVIPAGQEPPLPQSRLEQIMSSRAGAPLRQFGYDQLGRARAVTVSQTGAVQDDYVLGPGDEIVLSLRGQENGEFRATVDRNGTVLLPRLRPLSASGRSFGSFRDDLQAATHRAFIATDASISLGRVRQISVLVSGEVNNPGQRILSGLSSAVDAILLSGGVKKSGSLRSIRIQRDGHEYTVDLYSVLTARGGASQLRLADGDRILVPLLGPIVAVSGLVRQPGIFELPGRQSGISISALLQFAGGQEVRGRYRLSVLRIDPDGRSNLVPITGQSGIVHDSEILFVQLGADQTVNQATLSGSSGLAGAYAIGPGTRLSDVLRAPGALGNSPYSLFGLVVRKDRQTLLRSLLPFTPVAVLNGREDIQLQSDDTLKVFSNTEEQMLDFVVHTYLQRLSDDDVAIRNPLGGSDDSSNSQGVSNLRTISSQSSTQSDYVTNVSAEVQRREINLLLDRAAPGSALADSRALAERQRRDQLGTTAPNSVDQQPAVPQDANSQLGSQQPIVQQPGNQQQRYNPRASEPEFSEIQTPGQQSQLQQRMNQQALNQQSPPGQQGLNQNVQQSSSGTENSPAANFMESATGPGQYASNREAYTFGQLARQLNVDPLVLVNFLVDNRIRLEGALRGPGDYFVGPNATLNDVVQAAGGTVNWADDSGVELVTTLLDRQAGKSATQRQTLPLRNGTLASYVVRPRDQFRFSQVFSNTGFGSVTLQGEVRNPGTFSIMRGDHLSDLLARAGGLTGVAYPGGTVFLRQSAARAEHEGYLRAAREVEDQLVIAMTRVGNDKIEPTTFASMQTFVAELRNQQALGRISIVADPSVLATKPELDPLLEAGDVVYIPQRPSTISVLGQVMQPGSYPYRSGQTIGDYIDKAGGYSRTADEGQTFIVLPDGSARKVEKSWFSFAASSLPPGTSIVVPRDVTPLDLRQTIIDVSGIFSQFAVAIASVAVISRQ
jgi:protein involved in polysaccharide export with SLBB domain